MDAMDAVGKKTISRIKWHVMPFVFLLYIVNLMTRGNLAFAALEMNKALRMTGTAFGMLMSVFFISYFFFEVPSNMALHRFGARRWMARIMVSWGIVTSLMFFVQSFAQMGILRFVLGAAEAGFFPGMIFYFTFWFPAKHRAWAVSVFMLAIPVSMIISGPLSAWVMTNIHWTGQAGWRWLFMLEGLLSVLVGIATLFYLTDKPEDARWLNEKQREWLRMEMAKEATPKEASRHLSVKKTLAHPRIWRLAFIYFTMQMTSQIAFLWLPMLVKEFSKTSSNMTVGWLSMWMSIVAAIAMVLWSWHSDATNERKYHAAIPMLISVIGLLMAAFSDNLIVKVIGLTINSAGNVMYTGPFWSLPSLFLTAEAAAVGMAMINSMSSLGGFIGSNVTGILKDSSYGTAGLLAFQAFCCLVAFFLTITLRKRDLGVSTGTEGAGVAAAK